MLFAADDGQRLLFRNQSSGLLLFVQTEGGLGRQDACDRLVEPFFGHKAVFQTGEQKTVIFFQILVEQDHVRACGNSRGDRLLTRHGGCKAHHRGGIGGDEPVETKLVAQQAGHNGT